jgi:hypothetical protein
VEHREDGKIRRHGLLADFSLICNKSTTDEEELKSEGVNGRFL